MLDYLGRPSDYDFCVITSIECPQIQAVAGFAIRGSKYSYYFNSIEEWDEIWLYLRFYDCDWWLYKYVEYDPWGRNPYKQWTRIKSSG